MLIDAETMVQFLLDFAWASCQLTLCFHNIHQTLNDDPLSLEFTLRFAALLLWYGLCLYILSSLDEDGPQPVWVPELLVGLELAIDLVMGNAQRIFQAGTKGVHIVKLV